MSAPAIPLLRALILAALLAFPAAAGNLRLLAHTAAGTLDPQINYTAQYWQLYCFQRLAIGDRQKIFESDYASLIVDS